MGFRRSEGFVVRVTGKEVWVRTGNATIPCLLRGRFRKTREGFQIVAGDRVELSVRETQGGAVSIESILPRRSWLSRYTAGRDAAERVIVTNIDTLFLVESARSPDVDLRFVDRVLISAEYGKVGVRICLNKTDLVEREEELSRFISIYNPLGYPVIRTSAKTGEGVPDVASCLGGGIYAFVGRSGVGKSALLNRIAPGLDLKVGEVMEKTGRGRHTTTYSQLFAIERGYVADTPGMQTFGFPGSDKGDLARCFTEFRPLDGRCRFSPCTHSHEPDCAVKEAVEAGEIAPTRYESYLDMLSEVELRGKNRYT
jgi:ribosome biogenesis GTPase